MKKHLLFVCSSNLDRSPAAVSLFKDSQKYEAKSCGILPHSRTLVSKEAISWANTIFCMEDIHKFHIIKHFPEAFDKELIVLNIPNDFMRNDEELLRVLREKLGERGFFV